MSRKRLGWIAGLLLAAAGCGTAGLFWASLQVPDFYRQALPPDPDVRRQVADRFVQRTLELADGIRYDRRWAEEFHERQINAWLVEQFPRQDEEFLPEEVSDPRVRFEAETVQIGFRLNREGWNGVVSLRLRPWVSAPNRLAVEVQSVHAGLLPVPLDRILPKVRQEFRSHGWRIERSRSEGHDVFIMHLDRLRFEDGEVPVLEAVEVDDGMLRISGRRRTSRQPL